MRQPWQRWVDCTDGFGRARQVLVAVGEEGLEVRLPGGEMVTLHLFQAEQLRAAVVHGIEQARGDAARAARGGSSR